MLVNDAAALGGVPLVAVSSTLKNFTVLSTPLNDHFFSSGILCSGLPKKDPIFSSEVANRQLAAVTLSLHPQVSKTLR